MRVGMKKSMLALTAAILLLLFMALVSTGTVFAETTPAEKTDEQSEMYTRDAKRIDGLPGVFTTKAYPGDSKDKTTMGISAISKKTLTLTNGPTTESPAIIRGAATGYEIKTGPTSYDILKTRIAPYSYFKYKIIDEQMQEPDGTVSTHKKMSGFDGSYYIIRVDVSEIIKKYIGEDGMQGKGKYLHVKQLDNKALMVATGLENTTFADALGNKTGSYSLENNAAALKDTDGADQDTPYLDVIVMSSGKLAAGADAGKTDAPSGDIQLCFYVDDTVDYDPDIKPLDPNNMPTFPYKVGDREFKTEADYNKALLAKFFKDEQATAENNASSYLVKGSDLEIDVTVEEQKEDDGTAGKNSAPAEFWSLTNAIAYLPYDNHVIKLICEVPVLEGLSVEGNVEEGKVRSIIFDVNSFDIQIANNTAKGAAGLTVGEFAQFTIKDGTNTSGAELAIGNNATMDIRGVMIIDKSCTLEVEYDAATITDPTQQQGEKAVNGEITIRKGGQLANFGVINIEGAEAKPLQPTQQEQEAGQTVITDMSASDLLIEEGGTLLNLGCISVKGNLYVMGHLHNEGKYEDTLITYDPDKGQKSYHKGIQVTWKDDVTQEGARPGGIYIGYAGGENYSKDAQLDNYGDIVLVPGELHVFGGFINHEGGYLYVCDADEAVIPITPTAEAPLVVEKRVKIDPPKESVYRIHEEKEGIVEDYGRIGKAKVHVISNGVLGDLTPLEWKDISKAKVALEETELVYNGEVQTAKVKSVTFDGKTLEEGKDYTVSYSHKYSRKAGEYSVYVIGIGAYGGEKTEAYKILAAEIGDAAVTLTKAAYTYTGKTQKPKVSKVTLGETVLTEGTDYKVTYANASSWDVGTYKVTITGKGNFTGTVAKSYVIKAKGMVDRKGKTYFYDANGKMKTGWVKTGGKWYYFSKKVATKGQMQTGWVKDGGKWYYLSKKAATKGQMQTGWVKDGKWYFLKSDGSMAANEYCKGYWLNKDGSCTYERKASWRKDNGKWWYGDGKWYAKNCTLTIDGKTYSFDAKGYLK